MESSSWNASTNVRVEVAGHRLVLSNLDKVLYPTTGFTKAQVLRYYTEIAPFLLPHVRDRPLTVRRYPNGVEGHSFFEKHLPRGTPEWIRTVNVPQGGHRQSETIESAVLCDVASLVWVANLAALELHVPMWRADRGRPQPPDLMVFDLDPGPPAGIVQCAEVALMLADALQEDHGWQAFPKTSGSKGIQLYVPLPRKDRQRRWDDGGTRDEARHIALRMAREHPDLIVANVRKDLRPGKVLIDWSQNHVAKTTVAPYSLRAMAGPMVSTPLRWEEVDRCAGRGRGNDLQFLVDDVVQRVARDGDLMAPLLDP